MDFELSEDQVALRDAARDLLDDQASLTRVRAVFEADDAPDVVAWEGLVEQGWLGVDLPEEADGLGMGPVEVAVLAEEIGRHAAPLPFVSTVLALGALHDAGDSRAGDLLAGEGLGCVGWSSGEGGLRADSRNGGWSLSGRTDPVPWAPVARVGVVAAMGSDGPGVFAIDLEGAVRPGREPAMDRTRALGWIELSDAPATFLGGTDAYERLTNRGATFLGAELLGGADAALSMSVEYAKERVQFGRPIGSFQAVKHRCADMLVDVEGMRSTVYWAAWALSADDDDRSIAASTAKAWTTDASKRVMASALQVHGGIGFTWEHDLHFFLKRAQLDQLRFGDARFHRDRIAALLGPRVAAGESVI